MRREFSRMKLHCFDRTFIRSSHSLNAVQLPVPMETHLWYVNPSEVKSESLLKQYLDILSPCERENVLRLQGEELRKSALLARALVRTTIAKYQMNSPVEPRSLKFRKNMHGKPEVCWPSIDDWDPPPLHFNLSHTSSLIACGVTINSQEAYVKALGKGFSGAPFKTFTIRFQGVMEGDSKAFDESSTKGCEIVVDSLDDPTDVSNIWQFSLLELDGSHYAAICTEKQSSLDGKINIPGKLMVWKTIPILGDEYVSGTDAVKMICGFQ
ncbi:uncharacterized protein LOC121767285 isoform X2 [Salvia splendens]|uniref:uncharacterized protein LOC121767285 isoform X2 n=1 Tax=Salvia splendens TaxID=180675 RepID=UPI001C259C32|nr:uncharacterized protein LOC121767285 isoform X2 [Salvia splendens]